MASRGRGRHENIHGRGSLELLSEDQGCVNNYSRSMITLYNGGRCTEERYDNVETGSLRNAGFGCVNTCSIFKGNGECVTLR